MGICKYCEKEIKKNRTVCGSCCVSTRRWKSKMELIELLGGKCEDCGFNGHPASLEFHHRNPSEKSFELSGNKLLIKERYEEVKKCKLLCANCHAPYHVNETIRRIFAQEMASKSTISKIPMPSKEELYKMVSETPMNKIAKFFGVGDKTIKKWADEFGIDPKDYWAIRSGYNYRAESGSRPTKEDLLKMVQTKTLAKIGRELGVNPRTIKFWCKKYDIPSTEYFYNRKE